MVGTVRIDRKKIPIVAGRMLGARYNLYGLSPQEGFNCFSYVWYFYREVGLDIPDKFHGYTKENYLKKYIQDPDAAKEIMFKYFRKLGDPVNINYIWPGDFVFIRDEEIVNAIYVGNGNFLTCDMRIGVIVVPRKRIKYDSMEAIRPCLKQ